MSNSFAHDVLQPLIRGSHFERDAARDALAQILAGRVDGVLIASFLTALTCKGETVAEMTGFVDAMLDAATTLSVTSEAIDIVGTGGDQLHTVNVSTMASLTVAGCGVPVAKHGNRAASSSVGSADVLEALGVRLDVTPQVIAASLEHARIGFLFAPTYHHGLGYLTPIRRALGFRTIFNVLGPLANPARVRRSLIGVAQVQLLIPMAEVLHARGVTRAVLVHGNDGLDELSLGTTSSLHTVTPEGVCSETVDAGAILGLHHEVAAIRGGDTTENVAVVRRFLEGTPGPVMDVVCANAALALMVAGRASSLEDGFTQAFESVVSGRAATALQRLVEVSNS
ncbi:MAG: anthranilate phosphoribosyltransferase [Acidobacteria bacterium]|nr:anthranilate phosphoribosyltransferase [Acidobacteriota bacterium]